MPRIRFRATTPRTGATPVGVLGGIFDPVHNGHLAVAGFARDYFGLSKVLFVPSGRPPHKTHIGAPAVERIAMLRLALSKEPLFELRDDELRREGVSYTFDTLCKLTKEFRGGPLYFIIGSDNLPEIATWYRYRDVLAMVTLCVAHRPGYSLKIPRILRVGRIEKFSSPELDISSTRIRERIAHGKSFRRMVPKEVGEYIAGNKLYVK